MASVIIPLTSTLGDADEPNSSSLIVIVRRILLVCSSSTIESGSLYGKFIQ